MTSFIRFYMLKSYLFNISSLSDVQPQSLSSNMYDKILVPDKRLVVISNTLTVLYCLFYLRRSSWPPNTTHN